MGFPEAGRAFRERPAIREVWATVESKEKGEPWEVLTVKKSSRQVCVCVKAKSENLPHL